MNKTHVGPCEHEEVRNNEESVCRFAGMSEICSREYCPKEPMYTPMPDKIFIKYNKESETFDGKIIRPDSVKRMAFCKATVVEVGRDITEIEAGNVVLIHKYTGYRIAPMAIEGEDFYDIVVIKKEDVLIVFEEE